MPTTTKKQFTVWLNNKPGELAKLGRILQRAKVNIVAMCVVENADTGQVRFVADKPPAARKALQQAKLPFTTRDVLVARLGDVPGAMGRVGSALAKAKINLDYAYASTHPAQDDALVVIACDDVRAAKRALG